MTGHVDPMPTINSIVYPDLVHPEPRADEPPVYDHKTEAENALAFVSELGLADDEGERKQELLIEAQVHATLALVEQQRIANLIALGLDAKSPQIREGVGL